MQWLWAVFGGGSEAGTHVTMGRMGQGGLGTGMGSHWPALTCDIPAGAQVQLQPGSLRTGFSRPGAAGGAERCPFGCPGSILPQCVHLMPPGRGVEGGHLQRITAGWQWETAGWEPRTPSWAWGGGRRQVWQPELWLNCRGNGKKIPLWNMSRFSERDPLRGQKQGEHQMGGVPQVNKSWGSPKSRGGRSPVSARMGPTAGCGVQPGSPAPPPPLPTFWSGAHWRRPTRRV